MLNLTDPKAKGKDSKRNQEEGTFQINNFRILMHVNVSECLVKSTGAMFDRIKEQAIFR